MSYCEPPGEPALSPVVPGSSRGVQGDTCEGAPNKAINPSVAYGARGLLPTLGSLESHDADSSPE